MKLVPAAILDQLIYKIREPGASEHLKDWIREHARLHMVHGKPSSAHLFEAVDMITDEFVERTDGWEFEDRVEELGAKDKPEMLLALTAATEAWRQGKGRRRAPGGKRGGKGGGKKGDKKGSTDSAGGKRIGPTTKAGVPLCTDC